MLLCFALHAENYAYPVLVKNMGVTQERARSNGIKWDFSASPASSVIPSPQNTAELPENHIHKI